MGKLNYIFVDKMVSFEMIPWNSPEWVTKGSFEFDVVFTSNISGFVVQYIRKKLTYKKTPSSLWEKTDRGYWEIFYIDKGMSWNADRFAQTSLGKESEGCLIQIGYAYFFPYYLSEEEHRIYQTDVKLPGDIKRIFGEEMRRGEIKMANGLPSSLEQPKMEGLRPTPKAIIHKLTVNWGKHAEPLGSQLNYSDDGETIEGWDSVVLEEVFAGEKIYQKFPWTSNEKRPLLEGQKEKEKYLSEEEWEEVNLKRGNKYPIHRFAEPLRGCPYCRRSETTARRAVFNAKPERSTLFQAKKI